MDQKPKAKPRSRKTKSPAEKHPLCYDRPITPRPAFQAFALEDEWHGRRRLRGLGKILGEAKHAPNACSEIDSLYSEANGLSRAKWAIYYNVAGDEVHREEHVAATSEQAAHDLLTVAKNATMLLSMLLERKPELCRSMAATKSDWPVMADLTEKDWQREIAGIVAKLELGKDIKGYLLAARTADENVIRCWATAIYETLFQSRWDFKEAAAGGNKYSTTEGCPEWVRKTLALPPFTKADSRKWAKLGEEMLLQQIPDFLESPDLALKKRSWTHRAQKDSRSYKASLRAVQREAFEDFAKELKNIAPERDPWRGEW